MSFWLRVANHVILDDTREFIDPEDRQQRWIELQTGPMEAWVVSTLEDSQTGGLFALKFPGTGGRAERGGPHPCEVLSADNYEVWTINPPGYGGSHGRASVQNIVETAQRGWEEISDHAAGRPILVAGNSLGGIYALYVAAHFPVAGVFLRNPPPIHQFIKGHHSWWNFGWITERICRQIPQELDAVANAAKARAPAFFVMSENDRMIPTSYQQMIIDAYQGPKQVFLVEDADHHTPVEEDQIESYVAALEDWRRSLFDRENEHRSSDRSALERTDGD